jgi:hypothetical protein
MQAKSVEGLSKIEVMGELGSGDRDRWEVGGGRWERELGENASQGT